MLKRALRTAIGVSIGVTIGFVVLPRIFLPQLYNSTYPPVLQQALLYLAISYAICFFVCLLIEWIKSKCEKKG
ncbi:hypothetical protein DFR58_102102 [Anaerobacterium chartisolvens]|uniref:Solute:sodium symporter small subunit n=1 Tax=Anaerobacterium chartisolvens TaxID=1297424 RepID=A0A369BER0_9FIRM|nr:hypothetical protein [Anaerobacterium chartisolvens]RCX20033.1 hypothetical protein DFR58_102102 [Anaerobacterium chartisolvens]